MDNLQLPHKLTLNERNRLTLSGVTEVVSFDESSVVMRTVLGDLEVLGQELKIKNLSIDGGQMEVSGRISALYYEDPRPTGGLWSRLRK